MPEEGDMIVIAKKEKEANKLKNIRIPAPWMENICFMFIYRVLCIY